MQHVIEKLTDPIVRYLQQAVDIWAIADATVASMVSSRQSVDVRHGFATLILG